MKNTLGKSFCVKIYSVLKKARATLKKNTKYKSKTIQNREKIEDTQTKNYTTVNLTRSISQWREKDKFQFSTDRNLFFSLEFFFRGRVEIFGSLNPGKDLFKVNNKNTMSTSMDAGQVSLQRGELAKLVSATENYLIHRAANNNTLTKLAIFYPPRESTFEKETKQKETRIYDISEKNAN